MVLVEHNINVNLVVKCDVCGINDQAYKLVECVGCGFWCHLKCLFPPVTMTYIQFYLFCNTCIEQGIPETFPACEACGGFDGQDDEDVLMYCDNCHLGFHLECHKPALDNQPIGPWLCSDCQPLQENNK